MQSYEPIIIAFFPPHLKTLPQHVNKRKGMKKTKVIGDPKILENLGNVHSRQKKASIPRYRQKDQKTRLSAIMKHYNNDKQLMSNAYS